MLILSPHQLFMPENYPALSTLSRDEAHARIIVAWNCVTSDKLRSRTQILYVLAVVLPLGASSILENILPHDSAWQITAFAFAVLVSVFAILNILYLEMRHSIH